MSGQGTKWAPDICATVSKVIDALPITDRLLEVVTPDEWTRIVQEVVRALEPDDLPEEDWHDCLRELIYSNDKAQAAEKAQDDFIGASLTATRTQGVLMAMNAISDFLVRTRARGEGG